jgi:hypothetical protein
LFKFREVYLIPRSFYSPCEATEDNKVLLLMDNHKMHVSIAAITRARENGIIMLKFPPQTSQKLQPLDRCVFRPFKKILQRSMQQLDAE